MYLDEEETNISFKYIGLSSFKWKLKSLWFKKVLVGFFTYFLLHSAKFLIEFCKIKIHDSYSICMFKQIVQTCHTLTIWFNRTENFSVGYSTRSRYPRWTLFLQNLQNHEFGFLQFLFSPIDWTLKFRVSDWMFVCVLSSI